MIRETYEQIRILHISPIEIIVSNKMHILHIYMMTVILYLYLFYYYFTFFSTNIIFVVFLRFYIVMLTYVIYGDIVI